MPATQKSSASRTCGVLLFLLALEGCANHTALQRHTVEANYSVADIYYQQVLNNVARFIANPAQMPSFSVVTAGTVNVEDLKGFGLSPTYSPTLTAATQAGGALPILSILFGTNVQRAVSENWSTTPVTDSDNIRRLRCAFQLIVGTEVSECDRCKQRLEGFFLGGTETYECMMPRDWYHVGCKKDVPKDACYVGHHCGTYVWVTSEGLDGLSRFTITILDIATGEVHTPQRAVVKTYKGEPTPENLETTEVSSNEIDLEALKDISNFKLDRERRETPGINRGLFFSR